jgi:hypothetical protein
VSQRTTRFEAIDDAQHRAISGHLRRRVAGDDAADVLAALIGGATARRGHLWKSRPTRFARR